MKIHIDKKDIKVRTQIKTVRSATYSKLDKAKRKEDRKLKYQLRRLDF